MQGHSACNAGYMRQRAGRPMRGGGRVGCTHLYATSRIAAHPCSNDGKRKPRYAFDSGSGLSLNTASDTKPKDPSLPIIISVMFGPVEVRGTLHGLVMTPVGVTIVADTSMSSMLPYMQRKSHDSHVPRDAECQWMHTCSSSFRRRVWRSILPRC